MENEFEDFLLQDVIKVGLLFGSRGFPDLTQNSWEGILAKTKEFLAGFEEEKGLGEIGRNGNRVELPGHLKRIFAGLRVTGCLSALSIDGSEALPLAYRFRLTRELAKSSPLLVQILFESNLCAEALGLFGNEHAVPDLLGVSGEGKGVACFLNMDFKNMELLKFRKVEQGEKRLLLNGGLADQPLFNHDLYPDRLYLHLTRAEGKDSYRFLKIDASADHANGLRMLGFSPVEGSEFYVANLAFGHDENCFAEELARFSRRGPKFARLADLAVLQAAYSVLISCSTALSLAERVFADHFDGSREFLRRADNLQTVRSSLEGLLSIVQTAAFYFDLSSGIDNDETRHFEKVRFFFVALAGSHCLEEAGRIFHQAEKFVADFKGHRFRGLDTHRAILKNRSVHHVNQDAWYGKLFDTLTGKDEEHRFDALLDEMHALEKDVQDLDVLREALINWREYVAGLMLLRDALRGKTSAKSEGFLQSGRLAAYLGDVCACHGLLKAATVGEKRLKEKGIVFDELDASLSEEDRLSVSTILNAEYFSLGILTRNEGTAKIIERNCLSPLGYLGTLA